MRPVLLDTYCKAGGASRGYQMAGFTVVGVDIEPQPNFIGDEFHQGDAIEFIRAHGHEFDAIHASPPCQIPTRARHLREAQGGSPRYEDLIAPTREALRATGRPWVIENVEGAPLRADTFLCGSMFGLKVRRHRLFEFHKPTFFWLMPCRHRTQGRPVGVYHKMGDEIPHGGRTARTLEEAREAMGIQWMSWGELTQSIPPLYTKRIGAVLLAMVAATRLTVQG